MVSQSSFLFVIQGTHVCNDCHIYIKSAAIINSNPDDMSGFWLLATNFKVYGVSMSHSHWILYGTYNIFIISILLFMSNLNSAYSCSLVNRTKYVSSLLRSHWLQVIIVGAPIYKEPTRICCPCSPCWPPFIQSIHGFLYKSLGLINARLPPQNDMYSC